MLSIRLSVEFYEDGQWAPCAQISNLISEEPIEHCPEVAAVLKAHGRVIARYMITLRSRHDRFRILARETASGILVAGWGAHRSSETGQFLWDSPEPCSLCEWCPLATRCPDRPTLAA